MSSSGLRRLQRLEQQTSACVGRVQRACAAVQAPGAAGRGGAACNDTALVGVVQQVCVLHNVVSALRVIMGSQGSFAVPCLCLSCT